MITLSAFADEISSDLQEQISVLLSHDIHYLELRGVWGKNVLDLTDDELDTVKGELDKAGIGVSAIGSPIGKVGINDDLDKHFEEFKRIMEIAEFVNTQYVRLFSFYIPEGDPPENYREQVRKQLQKMVNFASETDIKLLHENERHIYGETGQRCLDLQEMIEGEENFGVIFDPANFVQAGENPYECFQLLKDYIEYCHIKDAIAATGKVVPAGEGDGEIKRILSELLARAFNGFLSLEPHLAVAGSRSGFTGPELFARAVKALTGILDELGADYD